MQNILLSLHLINTIALIVVILLQRSDGGALGIGGGGPGSMFSPRGQTNLLTKTTTILAASFMALSIALAIASGAGRNIINIPQTGESVPADTQQNQTVPTFPTLPELPDAEPQ